MLFLKLIALPFTLLSRMLYHVMILTLAIALALGSVATVVWWYYKGW